MLTTPTLFLMPATQALLDAAADERWDDLSSLLGGVSFADSWNHFPEAIVWMRDWMQTHPEELTWWSYFIIHGLDGRLIGTCGYKGVPSPTGYVEIGYEIAPAYQNQGLATEAAQALVKNASNNPIITNILAHTLPEENASTAVLKKLGFSYLQESVDFDEGKVWEWILRVREMSV